MTAGKIPLLEDAYNDFLDFLASGDKTVTVNWYKKYLRRAVLALRATGLDQTEDLIKIVRSYMFELHSRTVRYENAPQRNKVEGGLSDQTIANYRRALKYFFAWCNTEYGVPSKNPIKSVKLPKRKSKQDDILSKAANYDDIGALLETCDDTPIGKRDKAILAFMTDTGCRVGAVISLEVKDLFLDDRRVIVTTKFSERHEHYLHEDTVQLLREWLILRPGWIEHGYVFYAISDRANGKPLKETTAINQMINRRKKLIQSSGPLNPHAFRHALGTHIYEETEDPYAVKGLLHHKEISTSLRYVHVSREHWKQKHDQVSPIKKVLK